MDMPDPSLTVAAIQSHTTALEGAIGRHGTNACRCKVWSAAIVGGMLLLASGRVQMAALPWAAGVVVQMALADAGQLAMARVFKDAYNRFMAKLPLNGGNAMEAEEWLVLPPPALSLRQAGRVFAVLVRSPCGPFMARYWRCSWASMCRVCRLKKVQPASFRRRLRIWRNLHSAA